MTGFSNDYFAERERWTSQTAENSARVAWAYGTVDSTGWGEFLIPDPIMFGLTFVYEPIVSYGMSLADDDRLIEGRFPRATGGVARWVQDGSDFYVGAHVFITVATADPLLAVTGSVDYSDDPNYDLTHHFTFSALAIKDIHT